MNLPEPAFKPTILVAPLDWGLGHATRCIPLIYSLLRQGCSVVLVGEDKVKLLLLKEFPDLPFLDLPGYRIKYSRYGRFLPLSLFLQIPKILSIIKYENDVLRKAVITHKIDAIISDNRYGFHHKSLPSVFITHQLLIRTGFGKIADTILQKINYSYINRFTECWVPDTEKGSGLAGLLAHPAIQPSIPVKHLGPLSRFKTSGKTGAKHVLIILSGPEPQRTIFESMLLSQLDQYKGPVVLIRGLPGAATTLKTPSHIQTYNHLSTLELQEKMEEAAFIISRCGYSTVMDLAVLKKKSILVPTPGQTEQEYLAAHLMKSGFALCIPQTKFKLLPALELAKGFSYRFLQYASSVDEVVMGFVEKLKLAGR